jgi:hypothetical protein
MSRRTIANAERVLVEGTTGTRSWTVAVKVPRSRAQLGLPTRKELKERKRNQPKLVLK